MELAKPWPPQRPDQKQQLLNIGIIDVFQRSQVSLDVTLYSETQSGEILPPARGRLKLLVEAY